jgi:hypothetical protein
MQKRAISDTVLLSGWLFADLFLGLMVIFLAALPGAPPLVQTLVANSTRLNPKSPECSGAVNNYRCTITIGVTANSTGDVDWTSKSDMSDTIQFAPASGHLTPGQSTQIAVSAIPCQNGSFTFSGTRTTTPISVLWKCTLQAERLDLNPTNFQLTVHDLQGLLNNTPSAIDDIKQQVASVPFLNGQSVGFVIVSAGALTVDGIGQAQIVDGKIYDVFRSLGQQAGPFQRAAYYNNLYTLGNEPSSVSVDVFLFRR